MCSPENHQCFSHGSRLCFAFPPHLCYLSYLQPTTSFFIDFHPLASMTHPLLGFSHIALTTLSSPNSNCSDPTSLRSLQVCPKVLSWGPFFSSLNFFPLAFSVIPLLSTFLCPPQHYGKQEFFSFCSPTLECLSFMTSAMLTLF